jgi:hypothetical protein
LLDCPACGLCEPPCLLLPVLRPIRSLRAASSSADLGVLLAAITAWFTVGIGCRSHVLALISTSFYALHSKICYMRTLPPFPFSPSLSKMILYWRIGA